MAQVDDRSGEGLEPAEGHERRDFSLRYLVWFGIGLLAFVLVANLVSCWMFLRFEERQLQLDRPVSPLAEPSPLPPGARLQVAPEAELRAMRMGEQEMLNTYGWVDQQAGIVRVPVDRAMDMLLEKGLPVREPEEEDEEVRR